ASCCMQMVRAYGVARSTDAQGQATSGPTTTPRKCNVKHKLLSAGEERVFIIVLDPDEEAFSALGKFAQAHGIAAAGFTAIGAFRRATLGWFDFQAKTYQPIEVNAQCEALSVIGDIATSDEGTASVHAHAIVGLWDGTTRGGHLLKAYVNPTLEI